jgi:hypothetical protein
MAGKTADPKPHRVTLRLSETDLRLLRRESARIQKSIGNVIRMLIRSHLPGKRAVRR